MGKLTGRERGRGGQVPPEQGKHYVNYGSEDQMEISGYQPSTFKTVMTWIFIVLTVGLLRLVFYWKPEWMLMCTSIKCSLREAHSVLLKDQYMQLFVQKIAEMTLTVDKSEAMLSTAPGASMTGKLDGINEAISLTNAEGILRFFISKKVTYLWNSRTNTFVPLQGLDHNQTCSFFHQTVPLTLQQQELRRKLFGENIIDVKVDSISKLLLTQALNPFYIFQLASCILWYFDVYYYYASAIVIMSVVSLSVEVYQTRTMQAALKSTISANTIVPVLKDDDDVADMTSDVLTPGDIIEVPRHGCVMQCDAVLITGNCIVNESMLTGESVPVTKTPLPNPSLQPDKPTLDFSLKEHGRHTLFCGTQVIQTRYYGNQKVKAVVIRTGFSTAKGELVRSILFPKPLDFKFARDTYKFIGVLAGIASIGMVYTLVIMTQSGEDAGTIIKRMLDLITIVIPPALPAAMTIGTVFAQRRLKKNGIFCISPKSITLCGTINAFCFDKTGTLTEDGLDMWGVVPVFDGSFSPEEKHIPNLGDEAIVIAMATCHSLTIIEGQLSGDPLDLRMFESTCWDLEEPGEDTSKFDVFMPTLVRPKTPDLVRASQNFGSTENIPFEVGILRQFTFTSKLQRMSVIARTLGKSNFDLYSKGSPEMIASLCRPETVPKNFHEILLKYTQHGYRVLALAWKPLKKLNYVKVQRAQREQMERDLIFLGLLILENRLKPQTTAIIRKMKEAKIRTIMVTGDNMLTAISVARDCDMIKPHEKAVLVQVVPPPGGEKPHIEWNYAEDSRTDVKEIMTHRLQAGTNLETVVDFEPSRNVHFVITGKSWQNLRTYFPELIPKLVVWGTVFARFAPEQKQQLVESLQALGYYVGMCGDGANDCGALKTAHTGISLSEAEASVASPFTSKTQDISCVPNTIREGRAALVTSFGVFKYMASYSLTQFLTVCVLYWIGANLSDFTFLYIDLFIITTLGATFSYTGAFSELVPKAPLVSLISLSPILSLILHMLITTAFQIITWYLVKAQVWFEAWVPNDEDNYTSYEHSALFAISSFQYVTLAVIFAKAAPYRKTIFSNVFFLVNIILLTALNLWLVMYPTKPVADFFQLREFPSLAFRGIIVGLAIANFFVAYLLETYVLESNFFQKRCHDAAASRSRRKYLKYMAVEDEILSTPNWPPVSQSSQSLADLMKLESLPVGPGNIAGDRGSQFEDDEGEDDVMNCADGIRASWRRRRHRTKSGNSNTSSRLSSVSNDEGSDAVDKSLSSSLLKSSLKHSANSVVLPRYPADSGHNNVAGRWESADYDDSVPILQTGPDSPTSPDVPMPTSQLFPEAQAQNVQPLFVDPNLHTNTEPTVVAVDSFRAPEFPNETRL